MGPIFIEKTQQTPLVRIDLEKKTAIFEGVSFPENAQDFYAPIINFFLKLIEQNYNEPLIIDFKIRYYNSSSFSKITIILDLINRLYQKNKGITVNWYYLTEDITTREDIETIAKNLDLPINLKIF